MEVKLNEFQWKVMKELVDSNQPLTTQKIAELAKLDHSKVMGTVVLGQEKLWVEVDEKIRHELILDVTVDEKWEFDERKALRIIKDKGKISLKSEITGGIPTRTQASLT